MAETFFIKQDDRLPALRLRLTDNDIPVDLTDAVSARIYMSNLAGLKVDAAVIIAADQTEDGDRGIVEYEWADGDTDTVGTYKAEIEVEWPGQRRQTFPANGYQTVRVTRDLGDPA